MANLTEDNSTIVETVLDSDKKIIEKKLEIAAAKTTTTDDIAIMEIDASPEKVEEKVSEKPEVKETVEKSTELEVDEPAELIKKNETEATTEIIEETEPKKVGRKRAVPAAKPVVDSAPKGSRTSKRKAVEVDVEPEPAKEALVVAETKPVAKRGRKAAEVVPVPEAKVVEVSEEKVVAVPEAKVVAVPEAKAAAVPEAKAVAVPEAKSAAVPEAKAVAVSEAKVVTVPEVKVVAVPETKVVAVPEAKVVAVPEAKVVAVAVPKVAAVIETKSKKIEPKVALLEAPLVIEGKRTRRLVQILDLNPPEEVVVPKKRAVGKKATPTKAAAKSPAKKKGAAVSGKRGKKSKEIIESETSEEEIEEEELDETMDDKDASTIEPSEEEIRKSIESIIDGANLDKITMKTVVKDIHAKYPDSDLSSKKTFIKDVVKELLESA